MKRREYRVAVLALRFLEREVRAHGLHSGGREPQLLTAKAAKFLAEAHVELNPLPDDEDELNPLPENLR